MISISRLSPPKANSYMRNSPIRTPIPGISSELSPDIISKFLDGKLPRISFVVKKLPDGNLIFTFQKDVSYIVLHQNISAPSRDKFSLTLNLQQDRLFRDYIVVDDVQTKGFGVLPFEYQDYVTRRIKSYFPDHNVIYQAGMGYAS